MRRVDRSVPMFSVSALDVLATATGVFVLLAVMLMPFYRQTLDANAELEGVRPALESGAASVARFSADLADKAAFLDQRVAELDSLLAEAAALEEEIIQVRGATPDPVPQPIPTPEPARAPPPPTPEPEPIVTPPAEVPPVDPGRPIEEALDLVFVIDTTASMRPAIGDLARSLESIVRVLERLVPSLRISVVAYSDRDTGRVPVRRLGLTPTDTGFDRILSFIRLIERTTAQSRTVQEDLDLGLRSATQLPFRPNALQIVVVIGDAEPHAPDLQDTIRLAQRFVAINDRRQISTLYIVTPSALRFGPNARNFFRVLARAGQGSANDHAGSMLESVLLAVLVEE